MNQVSINILSEIYIDAIYLVVALLRSTTYSEIARFAYSEYKSCKAKTLVSVTLNLTRQKFEYVPPLTKINLLRRIFDTLVKWMIGYADIVMVLNIKLLRVF